MSAIPTTAENEIRVAVSLGARSYEVVVVTGRRDAFLPFARAALQATWAGRACRRALLVTDENLRAQSASYAALLDAAGIATTRAVLPAGECSKILDRAADLFDELVKMRADRHTVVVAVGGGVVGDLAGFVAATFARGLPLLMVPTTLLAQVDSSVGGKVGVNLPRAKNIVGAFHQPIGVWIDTESLGSLPEREVRCGLAEVVKYGVILDEALFEELERSVEPILARDPRTLRRIVAHSCRLKADVVTKDEREETGVRAVLNFGHTIGHAIEAVAGYAGAFRHGEAVAVGMVAESRLAERIGWVGPEVTARIKNLLERFGLPTTASGLAPDAILDAMSRDKKNQKGKIRFVLPKKLGHVELTDLPSDSDIRAALAEL
jgi:3-dehydroquinate synthase